MGGSFFFVFGQASGQSKSSCRVQGSGVAGPGGVNRVLQLMRIVLYLFCICRFVV
jgi:hypothetical protein